MDDAGRYYYNRLTKPQQAAYHAMKTGLKELLPSFPVPMLSGRELTDIYFMVRMDCPELFYSVKFSYRYYPGAETVELVPEYLFKKKQLQTHIQAMEARKQRLVRAAANMTEAEKELYIHDFICNNVRYDKLKKAYSHEIIGPMGQGVGVCEGIAKTVKLLCDNLGIWCIVALSEANPEKHIRYRHAWNILRIGGQYVHLDVTFDNTLSNENGIRYDYYNISDAQIFRDHEPVIWPVPACTDSTKFYYREKKLSFTKEDDVRKRAAQAAKKKKVLTFHWRGGYLTREKLEELLKLCGEAANAQGKYACFSLNWHQAVIQLRFSDIPPEETMILEEANEGEAVDAPAPEENTSPEA